MVSREEVTGSVARPTNNPRNANCFDVLLSRFRDLESNSLDQSERLPLSGCITPCPTSTSFYQRLAIDCPYPQDQSVTETSRTTTGRARWQPLARRSGSISDAWPYLRLATVVHGPRKKTSPQTSNKLRLYSFDDPAKVEGCLVNGLNIVVRYNEIRYR